MSDKVFSLIKELGETQSDRDALLLKNKVLRDELKKQKAISVKYINKSEELKYGEIAALRDSRDELLKFAKQHEIWSQWFDDDYNKLIQRAEQQREKETK